MIAGILDTGAHGQLSSSPAAATPYVRARIYCRITPPNLILYAPAHLQFASPHYFLAPVVVASTRCELDLETTSARCTYRRNHFRRDHNRWRRSNSHSHSSSDTGPDSRQMIRHIDFATCRFAVVDMIDALRSIYSRPRFHGAKTSNSEGWQ